MSSGASFTELYNENNLSRLSYTNSLMNTKDFYDLLERKEHNGKKAFYN